MKASIRKIGNSAGILIPAIMLREANAKIGDPIELSLDDGAFVMRPIIEKRAWKSSITLGSLIENYVQFEESRI